MRILIIFVFSFLSFQLTGQQRPSFLPNQIQDYGKPTNYLTNLLTGNDFRLAEFSYNIIGRSKFEGENTTVLSEPLTDITSRRALFLKVQIPIINSPGFKLLAGCNYQNEKYKIKFAGGDFFETMRHLDDLDLRTVAFDIRFIKSINDKSFVEGGIVQGFSGDLDGVFDFQNKYSTFQANAIYGYQFSDVRAAGIGLLYTQDFVDKYWLPILMYHHKYAPNWAIDALLPFSIYLKSFRDEKTIVSIGAEYSSNIFNINHVKGAGPGTHYAFDHAALAGTIMIEKQLLPWLWFSSKIGYQTNFSSTFRPLNEFTIPFEVDQTDTPFFEVSLFISSFVKSPTHRDLH